MTEAEWLECTEPEKMLAHLRARASGRKLRLFGCACCRRIWHWLWDERSRQAVEVSERYADGRATKKELALAAAASFAAYKASGGAALAAYAAFLTTAVSANCGYAFLACAEVAGGAEPAKQAALLRDLFGTPGRPVAVLPAWRTWQDGAAVQVARAIYEERCFEDFPVLADALEEAGCADAEVLNHCRLPGGHARGCWLLDALLGKE
jgi:hypothetical protein